MNQYKRTIFNKINLRFIFTNYKIWLIITLMIILSSIFSGSSELYYYLIKYSSNVSVFEYIYIYLNTNTWTIFVFIPSYLLLLTNLIDTFSKEKYSIYRFKSRLNWQLSKCIYILIGAVIYSIYLILISYIISFNSFNFKIDWSIESYKKISDLSLIGIQGYPNQDIVLNVDLIKSLIYSIILLTSLFLFFGTLYLFIFVFFKSNKIITFISVQLMSFILYLLTKKNFTFFNSFNPLYNSTFEKFYINTIFKNIWIYLVYLIVIQVILITITAIQLKKIDLL